jgi:hypothetical protein
MKKIVIASLAAFLLGTAALSTPAEARCWWNGYAWNCSRPHDSWRYHQRHRDWGPYSHRHHNWGPYSYGYGWRY